MRASGLAKLVLSLSAITATVLLPSAAFAAPAAMKDDGSGLCADVEGNTPAPGTGVLIWTCSGQSNQRWELTAAKEIRTFDGTRCLDASGQGRTPGTPLISFPCTGQTNQQWSYRSDRTIVGVQSGLCVDVTGASTKAGAKLQLWTCHGNANQRWTSAGLDPTPPTTPGVPKLSDVTCRSATLSWAASTDAIGVAAYDIYHDGQLMKSVLGSALTTSVTLNPGAVWGFYVNARDAAGNVSQASPTQSLTVPQCSVDSHPPSVPTGLSATAAGTAVTVRWSAASDDVGVTAYDVYRGTTKVGSTAALSYTDSGLGANTTYAYSVAARDAQGNVSAKSAPVAATTGAACSTAVCSAAQVATDTDIPWGLVALSNGTALYSRRDAQDIMSLNLATGAKTSLGTVPNVQGTDGEGGLLGIAVAPGYPESDRWIYVHHTSPTDNRIVRIQVNNGKLDLSTEQVLLSGIPRNKYHNGGRLRFGPDGKLYASTGDAQNGAYAQDVNSLAGKILRLNPDGSRPADNPFGNYVWSYGHRNPQGLAFDSQGRLWEQEFGNDVFDETNLITKGGNYGWPDCEGTQSQSGSGCSTPGYIAPKKTYSTANGSCSGIAIVRDVLYVACERGARLYRHVISGSELTNSTELFSGTYGRLRTVEPTPDGGLLLTTSTVGDKDSVANNSNEKILKITLGE